MTVSTGNTHRQCTHCSPNSHNVDLFILVHYNLLVQTLHFTMHCAGMHRYSSPTVFGWSDKLLYNQGMGICTRAQRYKNCSSVQFSGFQYLEYLFSRQSRQFYQLYCQVHKSFCKSTVVYFTDTVINVLIILSWTESFEGHICNCTVQYYLYCITPTVRQQQTSPSLGLIPSINETICWHKWSFRDLILFHNYNWFCGTSIKSGLIEHGNLIVIEGVKLSGVYRIYFAPSL